MRHAVGCLAAAAAALLFGSCAGSEPDGREVRMLDNSYAPFVIEVESGEPIRFVNAGRVPHNIIAVDGSFSSLDASGGANHNPGESATITIDEPGTYDIYCSLHATQNEDGMWEGMVGTVVVGGPGDPVAIAAAESNAPEEWTRVTRTVPGTYSTIQSAVDAADPGDLVLIAPGIYRESVAVTTPGLTIRGEDRNRTILDGEFTRENGITVTADGVAVENLTARNYTVNGFFWTGVTGYRGSYLTAVDDWVYGIYAFDSVDGLFEHSYASGSWDAGFYVGQCDPCNALVTNVVAEFNGLGYSGTNSSGNMYIVNSEWRHNVAGIVPNTLDSEELPPSNNVVVAGNYIHHNGEDERAPNGTVEWAAYGNGVLLAGVRDSVVRNNLVVNNKSGGVQVMSMIDQNLWRSGGNEIRDNVIMGSGRADLLLGGPLEQGSCFTGNDATTTVPFFLRLFHDCEGINLPLVYGWATPSEAMGRVAQVTHGQNPVLEHGDAPNPALEFEQLPGGADAPVRPAVGVFAAAGFDPAAIVTPLLPDGVQIEARHPVFLGIAVNSGFWPVLMGALLWWVPLLTWIIGAAWAILQIWSGAGAMLTRAVWTVVVLAVPALGVLLFVAAGYRAGRRRRRLIVSLGGLSGWLAAVAAAVAIGGVF